MQGTAEGEFRHWGRFCECRRQIEDCRCRLAILHATSKRSLFGWQQRILVEISLQLYRLSRCCLANCAGPTLPVQLTLAPCSHRHGMALLNELQGLISDCARQMEQGAGIDEEVGQMGRINRALRRVSGPAGPGC